MTVLVSDTSAPAVNVLVAAEEMNELPRETAIENFSRILVLKIVDNDGGKACDKVVAMFSSLASCTVAIATVSMVSDSYLSKFLVLDEESLNQK